MQRKNSQTHGLKMIKLEDMIIMYLNPLIIQQEIMNIILGLILKIKQIPLDLDNDETVIDRWSEYMKKCYS